MSGRDKEIKRAETPMDEKLKEAHRIIRSRWTERAPPLAELLETARASGPDVGEPVRLVRVPFRTKLRAGTWKWATATALAVPVVLTVVLLARRPGEAERFESLLAEAQAETRLGYWEGPTEFLLEIPGNRLSSYVPTITWAATWLETGPDLEDLTRNGSEP